MLPTLLATRLMRKKHTPVGEKYYSVFGKKKGLKIQYWFLLPTYLRCNEQRFY